MRSQTALHSVTQSSCAHQQHFTQSHSLHALTASTSLSHTVFMHSPTALHSVTQSSCTHQQHFTQSHGFRAPTDSTSFSPTVFMYSPTALHSVPQSSCAHRQHTTYWVHSVLCLTQQKSPRQNDPHLNRLCHHRRHQFQNLPNSEMIQETWFTLLSPGFSHVYW